MTGYRLTIEKMRSIIETYKLMAEKYNGKFKHIMTKGPAIIDPVNNKARRFELKIPLKGSNMIFSTSEHHHFKMEYIFRKQMDFELHIYPEDYIEKISKLFGMKELEIGNREFDNKYIIKTNHPDAAAIILDQTVQKFMNRFKLYSFYLSSEEGSKLMIMPVIQEGNPEELDAFIIFCGHLVSLIIETKG